MKYSAIIPAAAALLLSGCWLDDTNQCATIGEGAFAGATITGPVIFDCSGGQSIAPGTGIAVELIPLEAPTVAP